MSPSIAVVSNQATCGSAGRESRSLPQGLPNNPENNPTESRLSKFIKENCQTSVGTSREALRRYFSSADCPGVIHHHVSVEDSVACHEDKVIGVIDTVDSAMKEQEFDKVKEQQEGIKAIELHFRQPKRLEEYLAEGDAATSPHSIYHLLPSYVEG